MLKTNEYFDGKVMSIAFKNSDGEATAGVMEKGEYEFATSKKEYMNVTSGKLTVLLPDATDWQTFEKGQTFIIEPNQKFKVKVEEQSSYVCEYK